MEPLRILHVVTYMGRGGLETMLMNYYRNIDRDKIQFDFLTHRQERWDYDDEIEALGGKIYRLPNLNPFSKTYLNALKNFFSEHPEYKIVHSHLDCMSSIPLKAAKEAGVPVRIAHSHSNNQDKDLKYPLKLYFKSKIKKYATHLFACSEEAGKWTFKTDDFKVIANAIDAEKYTFNSQVRTEMREELGIKDEYVVGHVGRFSPPKNHNFIIEIFNEFNKNNPDSKLLLVGGGSLEENIKSKISELNLEDKVILAGVKSNVNDYLQAMDVFVLPSFYEGLGIVAIEAQAAGLPCIVSNGVSTECKKTDLVKRLSLDDGPSAWAKVIEDTAEIERRNTFNEILKSGFDIKDNAKRMEQFYLSL